MTDDLLTRLDEAANDTHYIDHQTAREAAARIRELEEQRDAAEARETLAAEAAVKYLERAESAEAQVERNAAIAFHALQRATLAEEWRDHDKTRAESAEAALATARRDALDEAAKVADDHTPEKHSGMTLASHVTGRTIAAAIRAISAKASEVTCDTCRFAAWRDAQIGQCTWRATIPVAASSGIAGGALTVQGGFIWRGFDLECVVGLPPE